MKLRLYDELVNYVKALTSLVRAQEKDLGTDEPRETETGSMAVESGLRGSQELQHGVPRDQDEVWGEDRGPRIGFNGHLMKARGIHYTDYLNPQDP